MPPSIVVMIQDHSSLELRVRLPEKALATVKPGMLADVEIAPTTTAVGEKK
jgi:hypothetical protein